MLTFPAFLAARMQVVDVGSAKESTAPGLQGPHDTFILEHGPPVLMQSSPALGVSEEPATAAGAQPCSPAVLTHHSTV